MSETQPDYNLDYDEYEQIEAEAEQLAKNPNAPVAPSGGARNRQQAQAPQAPQRPQQQRAAPQPQVQQQSEEEQLAELEADTSMEDEEVANMEKAEKMPKWVPFHQPEKIGIINTETREIMEGFKDDGTATGMAKILNEIDTVIIGGGYQ